MGTKKRWLWCGGLVLLAALAVLAFDVFRWKALDHVLPVDLSGVTGVQVVDLAHGDSASVLAADAGELLDALSQVQVRRTYRVKPVYYEDENGSTFQKYLIALVHDVPGDYRVASLMLEANQFVQIEGQNYVAADEICSQNILDLCAAALQSQI